MLHLSLFLAISSTALSQTLSTTSIIPDNASCLDQNLTSYLLPPLPTDSLSSLLVPFITIPPTQTTSPCIPPASLPASLDQQYASYGSEVAAWYADRSDEIDRLRSECPNYWSSAVREVGGEALARAAGYRSCYPSAGGGGAAMTGPVTVTATATATASAVTATTTATMTASAGPTGVGSGPRLGIRLSRVVGAVVLVSVAQM
ncbi:hypothetical protein CAC42_4561 [Sphaceloma murrayae]|uniref:DUF7735 domain-containing protein n=1 Tax=Sphaceloma murrayae TaxID=2082308 RepID=A0A2K1QMS1_9PEZI|nr:hypothetical protein CAC42_4561 [Sphaceloma murrayae]